MICTQHKTEMGNLQGLEDSALIDMLAQYTERMTYLFRNYVEQDPDYQNCKETIQYIILELAKRGKLSQPIISSIQNEGEQSLQSA